MSFQLTTPQFRGQSKFVTRRLGWKNAKPGEIIMGIEKGMGLKKGEKQVELGKIRVVSNRQENLNRMALQPLYGQREAILEGFPKMSGGAFVEMFCKHNGCKPNTLIQRIAFEYV